MNILNAEYSKRIAYFVFVICFFAFAGFIITAKSAHAATLYFSPSSGTYTVGDILTVNVFVNTQGDAINNADVVVSFPSSLLEVVSFSKSGSIFSLWVEEPAFSNNAGTISFNGGLPTPGFNGTAGRAISVVFRAKSAGTATVLFSSGVVRANDGFGTDVLKATSQAQFNLVSKETPLLPGAAPTPPPTEAPAVVGTPRAPSISSPTHPDSQKWYAQNSATFAWQIPSDINASQLVIGRNQASQPSVLYVPALRERIVGNLDDGIWYFNVQLRNSAGWGGIGRFKAQIDTKPPERFDITMVPRDDLANPRVHFVFSAHDQTSGIDYYEVQIDGGDFEVWRDDGDGSYQTSPLQPGIHRITVKAVDKAGNFLASATEFAIDPSEALKPPVILEYPQAPKSREPIVIRGTTYPDADVTILLQRGTKTPDVYAVKSDAQGNFVLELQEGLAAGSYSLQAAVSDTSGAQSDFSGKITFTVKWQVSMQVSSFITGLLVILMPLAVLLIVLFVVWHIWYKLSLSRKRLRKEIREAEEGLHRAFVLLKEDVHEQVSMLEKIGLNRPLTEDEQKIFNRLRRNLGSAEKFMKKEIKDIRKEIKNIEEEQAQE